MPAEGSANGNTHPRPVARTRSAWAPISNTATRSPAAQASLSAKHQVSGQTEGMKPISGAWAAISSAARSWGKR